MKEIRYNKNVGHCFGHCIPGRMQILIKVTLEVQKVRERRSEFNTYSKAPFCQTKSFRERNSTPLSSKKRTFVDFKLLRGKRDGEYINHIFNANELSYNV